MGVNGVSISKEASKIITIRFNNNEYKDLVNILKKYRFRSRAGFIKQVLFSDIKPFLDKRERELIIAYIIELNAIGRNLNQLLKYKAHEDAILLVEEIKKVVERAKKIL